MASLFVTAAEVLLALQLTQASVTGTVRDGDTHAPLVGAIVAFPDLGRSAVTDASGRYHLRDVPAGPQHLTVRIIGYAERTLHALVPREGELEIDIALRSRPIPLRAVDVRPVIAVRGVERGDSAAFPDRGLSIAAVRTHPLLAEPDVLLALAGGEVLVKPEAETGLHVRGGASDQVAYVIDGIPVFSPYHAAGIFSAWNPDALGSIELAGSAPSPALPDALSGVVSAVTRAPGSRFSSQGSLSTTQARVTVDGPMGLGRAGYLVSFRSALHDVLAPRDEASYLRSEGGDLLAKMEAPALGGRLRLLGYDSENEIDAAAVASDVPDGARNGFAWRSTSLGGAWLRPVARGGVRVQVWSASSDASALWHAQAQPAVALSASRRDVGLLAAVQLEHGGSLTSAGVRLERSRTSYEVEPAAGGAATASIDGDVSVGAGFIEQARRLGARIQLEVAAGVLAAGGEVRLSPRARLRWNASDRLTLSSSYARAHQLAQSLRNPESIVGTIFPVDLYLGSGAPGVPVARSDQGIIGADYRPLPGVHIGVQAYARRMRDLLLVAPNESEPFAIEGFTKGSGTSQGWSLELAMSGTRVGVVGSYGWQRVRLAYGDSSYVPDHGTTHVVDAGVIVFPSTTSSIRLGASGALGRRTTTVDGGLKWEACNLLDHGCEFSGSPRTGTDRLGGAVLPAYLRVDLGFRKHWHIEVGSLDAAVALFGTITNVFARGNVLTYVRDPATGERAAIGMRPVAPLVIGLDWRL